MTTEMQLVDFILNSTLDDFPKDVQTIAKQVLLTTIGTAVAGAKEPGCLPLRELLSAQGGQAEATAFVYGIKLPAANAALLNGVMCRALDFCDAMAPGLHIGSSLIPAAFAAVELRGQCSGAEFLTALVIGCEVAARFNLTEAAYNGLDPTGIAGVFGATAAVCRILQLTPQQTLNALGLAFNRSGGSFQSNVDGSLAVRIIQGWVAESAVMCARYAQAGLTGPRNFIAGVYGYAHLYSKGTRTAESFVADFRNTFVTRRMMFKKYPSCGLTQGVTELTLQAMGKATLTPETISAIEVRLPPYGYRLVGHPFELGDNPRVNGQFSAQFCVTNAILHGCSRLQHFEKEAVETTSAHPLMDRITVVADSALNDRDHTAVDLTVTLTDGQRVDVSLDIAPGFPDNPLSEAEHVARFRDCMAYAPLPLSNQQIDNILAFIDGLADVKDAAEALGWLKA